ncbi:DUF6233 domain-containing protein [Streptomyces sp. NPDC012421]|uniref:DUF6233 domain-containing protein n=1 Tax=Streptomyces sp. NPDC012421 TaxID=3364832 RepID=UPI0036EE847F
MTCRTVTPSSYPDTMSRARSMMTGHLILGLIPHIYRVFSTRASPSPGPEPGRGTVRRGRPDQGVGDADRAPGRPGTPHYRHPAGHRRGPRHQAPGAAHRGALPGTQAVVHAVDCTEAPERAPVLTWEQALDAAERPGVRLCSLCSEAELDPVLKGFDEGFGERTGLEDDPHDWGA